MGEPPGHRDGHAAAMARIRAAFPDWREEIEEVVFEADRIVVRYVSTGTQDGPFLDRPPSGAKVRVDGISIFRIADGRIAEQWCLIDDLAFFQQIRQGAG
nr:ester cyclase [Neoroseomonas eburnea]